MTVIESLRRRLSPESHEISDEELLRITEGTYMRCFAEIEVVWVEIREELATRLKRMFGR